MKKIYAKLLFAFLVLFSANAVFAQTTTYTRGDIVAVIAPSMNHDSTACQSTCTVNAMITINSSFVGDSVMVVDTITHSLIYAAANTTGTSPWNVFVPIPMYMSTVPDYNLGGGAAFFKGPVINIISGTDRIDSIPNFYILPVSNPCTYGNVTGKVYVDNNSDCTFNTGDVPLNGITVYGTANLSSPAVPNYTTTGYTGTTGDYTMTMQQSWMNNYSVYLPSAYYFIFPVTPCFATPYTLTTLPGTNLDFPLQCTNNVDVQCWAGSPANARPSGSFFMQPYVSNIGCDSASGTLTFIKDSRVIYNPSLSTNPAMTVSGDTLTWTYTNLTNLSAGAYWNSFMSDIHLTPNATVNIGDTLCFRVYTNILSNDIDVTNNDYNICIPVVASYDPNIKEVSPRGVTAAGNIPASTPKLEYTIHFQNTGTSYAYNVSVVDTLDGDVDQASLKILGTSHLMNPEWLAPGVVRFNFNSIYLPDSNTNEPASHGYVRFKVNLHSALPVGTQIRNKGYIYFDANPAVITNEALNTIAGSAAVTNVAPTTDKVRIYPNPATSEVTIENLQNGTATIMSINGTVVFEKDINANKTTIDISRLPAGIYILKTTNNNSTVTTKFVKQ